MVSKKIVPRQLPEVKRNKNNDNKERNHQLV